MYSPLESLKSVSFLDLSVPCNWYIMKHTLRYYVAPESITTETFFHVHCAPPAFYRVKWFSPPEVCSSSSSSIRWDIDLQSARFLLLMSRLVLDQHDSPIWFLLIDRCLQSRKIFLTSPIKFHFLRIDRIDESLLSGIVAISDFTLVFVLLFHSILYLYRRANQIGVVLVSLLPSVVSFITRPFITSFPRDQIPTPFDSFLYSPFSALYFFRAIARSSSYDMSLLASRLSRNVLVSYVSAFSRSFNTERSSCILFADDNHIFS